ncbi:MAG: BolA family protein [Geminicoccaceae bacterium]
MAMTADEIKDLIVKALPGADVIIDDLAGDGNHYHAKVVAPDFEGKSKVQQHQLVYQALGNRMGGELHALALTTETPR